MFKGEVVLERGDYYEHDTECGVVFKTKQTCYDYPIKSYFIVIVAMLNCLGSQRNFSFDPL